MEQRLHEHAAQLEATNRVLEQEIHEHRKTEATLRAILDSTADGILVVDNDSRIMHANARFAELWRIPQRALAGQDDHKLLALVLDQLEDPEAFLAKVRTLYQTAREDFDILRFKDGRIFERLSCPLRSDTKVEGRVWCFRDITERKRAEEAWAHERHLLYALMDNCPDRVYFKDAHSRFTRISKSHAASLGLNDPREAIGKTDADFKPPEFAEKALAEEQQIIATGQPLTTKIEQTAKPDGHMRWTSAVKAPIKDTTGHVAGIVGISRDITREMEMQQQLEQTHKMEAVGRLAGGIAHDFNNILQAIGGFTEILLETTEATDQRLPDLMEIQKATRRATDLTGQLLAFGRRQMLMPRRLNLNQSIHNIGELLRRLLGEDIQITTILEPRLAPVQLDPSQLEQIIVNLAVHARDAMPNGGRVTINTANVIFLEKDTATNPKVRPGPCVRLSISDTSEGLSQDVLARIFEPFFTTKAQGRGAGLGLAVVYGIIEQSNGWIDVQSQPGQGSTFRIYFPAHESEPNTCPAPPPTHGAITAPEKARGRGERILLVEDEAGVRNVALHVLQSGGYDVVATESAQEALLVFARDGGRFDLLFSDVVLTDGNGVDLAAQLKLQKPELAILLSSGYTDERSRWGNIVEAGFPFLQKPYPTATLLRLVGETLAGRASQGLGKE